MHIPDIIPLPPNRVWRTYPGGRELDRLAGLPDPRDDHFPEDWIGSTTRAVNQGRKGQNQEGLSSLEIGGRRFLLEELFAEYPDAFLGKPHYGAYGARTQFLLKLLDSAIRLHIQAHPTRSFARQYLQSNSGKTEAYVILAVREGVSDPYIYLGFQHPPSKEAFREAVLAQDERKILGCFDKIPIQPGDVFVVPGGLPHAIGEGVLMIEIMEPSDLVVRLEFERGGYTLPEEARFMGRDVDFALGMIDFTPRSAEEIRQRFFCTPCLLETRGSSREDVLIDHRQTPCFRVHRLTVGDSFRKQSGSFYLGVVARGEGRVRGASGDRDLRFGDAFLVPFKTEELEFESTSGMELVFAFPPTGETE